MRYRILHTRSRDYGFVEPFIQILYRIPGWRAIAHTYIPTYIHIHLSTKQPTFSRHSDIRAGSSYCLHTCISISSYVTPIWQFFLYQHTPRYRGDRFWAHMIFNTTVSILLGVSHRIWDLGWWDMMDGWMVRLCIYRGVFWYRGIIAMGFNGWMCCKLGVYIGRLFAWLAHLWETKERKIEYQTFTYLYHVFPCQCDVMWRDVTLDSFVCEDLFIRTAN